MRAIVEPGAGWEFGRLVYRMGQLANPSVEASDVVAPRFEGTNPGQKILEISGVDGLS